MKFIANIALVLTACATLTGCAVDPDAALESDVQLLGEAACATVSRFPFNGLAVNGRSQTAPAIPACGLTTVTATSPNASYSNSGCLNQFISEVRGINGQPLSAVVRWPGNTLTSSGACGSAAMGVALYGRLANGSWVKVGQTRLVGQWVPASSGLINTPAYCNFVPGAGEGPLPSLAAGHPYNAVRAVGYAIGFLIPQPVTLGVTFGTGPC